MQPAGIKQLQELVERIIGLSVPLAFIILTVMLVIGGIKYLTSGGDAKALGSASGTITWAILGIVFLVVAWLVLQLITAFTGVDILNVCIGFSGENTNNCPN